MATYVFAGQGSQFRGMGESLFSEFPEIVEQTNKILGYSITDLCLQDPNELLSKTQYTQVAVYVVNALDYMKKAQKNSKPHYVAGHSLGEYNALLAADVFNFETGLRLVQKRSELMGQITDGSMAAILGLKSAEVEKILREEGLTNISIANYNSYKQIVISGTKHEIYDSQTLFRKAGASLFIPLQVSGAFHSPHMNPVKQQFAYFLDNFNFNDPTITVIANVNAMPYQADGVKHLLVEQITQSVRWLQTIEYLLAKGESDFLEIAPRTVLTKLISQIQQDKQDKPPIGGSLKEDTLDR